LLGGFVTPLSAATGGVISPLCPPNAANPSDLAKPPTSAEGAAARIKKDEAEAKARRAAVRYLGTVDCRHWPEAEEALINALRADRNECVRFEAASALGNGCCCTKKVVEALRLTVTMSAKDGNPAENSPRVRHRAEVALEHCQSCADPGVLQPRQPERPARPETPTSASKAPGAALEMDSRRNGDAPAGTLLAASATVDADEQRSTPTAEIDDAPLHATPVERRQTAPLKTGQRSLWNILRRSTSADQTGASDAAR
jgi:hypothetical protein